MLMCCKHINTHRNPGADAENIIAHFSIDFKQCRLKDEIFGKAFGILNPFFSKGCIVYDSAAAWRYRLYREVLSVRLGIVSLYETNRTYVFSLHIRPVFLLSFMQRM